MDPDPSTFSIVIPTHDRPGKLKALLDSLRRHRSSSLSGVVIVDDSESPLDLRNEYRDLNVEHLRLDKRVFYSRAKNIGWHACSSDLVFFIDDDNVATESTFDPLLQILLSKPETAAIMPSVLYKDRPDLVWVYATPLAPDGWGHTLIGRNRARDPRLENRLMDTDALPNASMVRREALERIGGFNEDLVMSSSADAAIRLKRAGWKVYAYSGAFVLHDVEPPGRTGYWAAHGAADPERVFFDVRDWFLLMRLLHPNERHFAFRATRRAMRFMLPNGLSYVVRDGLRGGKPLVQLVRGCISGVRATRSWFP